MSAERSLVADVGGVLEAGSVLTSPQSRPSRLLSARELKACELRGQYGQLDRLDRLAVQAMTWYMSVDSYPRDVAARCYRVAHAFYVEREAIDQRTQLSIIAVESVAGIDTGSYQVFERCPQLEAHENLLLAAATLAAQLSGSVQVCAEHDDGPIFLIQGVRYWTFTYAEGLA